jgi:hypothetical protein
MGVHPDEIGEKEGEYDNDIVRSIDMARNTFINARGPHCRVSHVQIL